VQSKELTLSGLFRHRRPALQTRQGLHLTDDFAASGVRLEHLPEKALAGQAQGVEPVPTVGPLVGGSE
jgi:hypothetical protein